jgi:hypothetical protein
MFNVIFVFLRKKLSKEGRDEESPRDELYLQDLLNLNSGYFLALRTSINR